MKSKYRRGHHPNSQLPAQQLDGFVLEHRKVTDQQKRIQWYKDHNDMLNRLVWDEREVRWR